jgi:hypothetical protein
MQTRKITATEFNTTKTVKHAKMTRKMYRMCVDSNVASFEKYQ